MSAAFMHEDSDNACIWLTTNAKLKNSLAVFGMVAYVCI